MTLGVAMKESVPVPVRTLTDKCNENLKMAKEIEMMIDEIRGPLFGYPNAEVEKNGEPCTIDQTIEKTSEVLCGALKAIHTLRERL